MREYASSQEIGSQRSSPRLPTRRSGERKRRGFWGISRVACPRIHRNPRLSGFSGSPLIDMTRSCSTSTSMPHCVGLQFIGHIVLIWRLLVGIYTISLRATSIVEDVVAILILSHSVQQLFQQGQTLAEGL